MSRVIIKNLPKQISEDEIRKIFSKKGSITDVKLKYKNGEFRRFGFIGYENEEDAEIACNFFNNTFVKHSRITVEISQNYGSAQNRLSWAERNKQQKEKIKEKSWERTSEDGTNLKKKNKGMKRDESSLKGLFPEKYRDSPGFGEFLEADEKCIKNDIMSTLVSGSSEGDGDEDKDVEEDGKDGREKKTALKKDVSDLDYLKSLMKSQPKDSDDCKTAKKTPKERKELQTVVIRAKGMCKSKQKTFKKKSVQAFLRPLICRSLRIPRNIKFVAYVGFKTEKEVKQALQKDRAFLDGVQVHIVKYEKPSDIDCTSQNSAPWSAAEEKMKNAEPIGESGKIFVRNLWYSVTDDQLHELFEKYGQIADINLPICKYTRRPKGFATVTFVFPEHAARAMTELDGTNFKGRLLHILPAVDNEPERKPKESDNFKDKRASERKATAQSWHNWNTLFLGSGAIVDMMAEKYNRSKQEILGSEGKQSVAVNLALGETQIVDETKQFLEDNGVSLEAFSSPGVQRSNTVILVKNLPAKTAAQELSEIFSQYGEIGRVVLPPSGMSGIIEYLNPGEAKNAFRKLAYSRFKYSPLYLEWAPVQIFKTEFTMKPQKEKGLPQEKENISGDQKKEKEDQETTDVMPDAEPNTTIYIKNLNFSTTDDMLKKHFEKIGPVQSVLIVKRHGLSQGYGFVQYQRRSDAQKSLREMNESSLEGHTIQIKLSEKTLTTQLKSARRMHDAGKQTSSKIMVKNVPFQATPQEVKHLFVTFGELKAVRMPNKRGSTEHRGFGFIDFVSRDDAKKAFEALRLSTHLYGRRLVLEWAKEEETVEELRKKTAEHFLAAGPSKKRSKVELDPKTKEDSDDD